MRNQARRGTTRDHRFSQELVLVVPNQADVVEAELVEDVPASISTDVELMRRALDALFSEDGSRLVPPPLAAVAPLYQAGAGSPEEKRRAETQQRRAELLAVANEVVQDHAQSQATGASYGSSVRAWRAWCAEHNEPELPFDPQRVMEFIVFYAFARNEAGEALRDPDGHLIPAVASGTVSQRLAALNKAAEYLGLPRPGDNAGVQQLMKGLRQLIGAGRRYEKEALDLSALEKCIAAAAGASYPDVRARAAVLLRARTGATTGQLHRLRWSDITAERAGQDPWHGPATGLKVTLGPTHRYGEPSTAIVRPHRNADLCLVEVLRTLRTLSSNQQDEVFVHPEGAQQSGKPLTRQALHLVVRQAAGDASWEDLPTLKDRALARVLAAHAPVEPLIQTRNTALLLTGFYTAIRRANLAALKWRDVHDEGTDPRRGGVTISVYRTKTDPEGTRKVKWLAQAPPTSKVTCPATAMRAWHSALTATLGRLPEPDEPVFVSLHASGAVKMNKNGKLKSLSGQDVCDIVQQLTVAAGLDAAPQRSGGPASTSADSAVKGAKRKKAQRRKYGAHSLRIGFVTEGLTDDKLSIAAIQAVTDHKSVGVLMDYHRQVNSRDNNPARMLMNRLMEKDAEPTAGE